MKNKKVKSKILSGIIAMCMLVGLFSGLSVSAAQVGTFTVIGGTAGIDYSYANNVLTVLTGTALTVSGTSTTDRIVVQDGTTANLTLDNLNIRFTDGSNSVAGTCAFEIAGAGTANITLLGTNTLESGDYEAGLQVQGGATLNILAESTGALHAIGGVNAAGIGGDSSDFFLGSTHASSGGNITIAGGKVVATGGGSGAGIGGGENGNGGNITISGGTVTATSGSNGAGIGGGENGNGGNITISGGTVSATGGTKGGAGIGGGLAGDGGIVNISGGNVNATGNGFGSGIGGGANGNGGDIAISGGTVNATGNGLGAGIGGGKFGATGTVTLTGGTTTAIGVATPEGTVPSFLLRPNVTSPTSGQNTFYSVAVSAGADAGSATTRELASSYHEQVYAKITMTQVTPQVTPGTPLTYNGTQQTQSVTAVTLGGTPLTDYILSGNTATNAGDYTMTLTAVLGANGRYDAAQGLTYLGGTYTMPYRISPVPSAYDPMLSPKTGVYN